MEFLVGGDQAQRPDDPAGAAAPAGKYLTMGGEPPALDPWAAERARADAPTAVAWQDPIAMARNWDSLGSKDAAMGARLNATHKSWSVAMISSNNFMEQGPEWC